MITIEDLKVKEKGWWWKLTIFAANGYTCIHKTVYYPKGRPPSLATMLHELIHARDMDESKMPWPIWILVYLFAFPFWYNPLRWKTEFTAYAEGSCWNHKAIVNQLSSWKYGWLYPKFHQKVRTESVQ